MTEVVAPDGNTIVFPDGMSHDEIRDVMRQKYPPTQPAEPVAEAAEPMTTSGDMEQDGGLGRSLQIGTQGVGRGLAELALGPADLVNLALNAGASGIESAGSLFGADLDLGRLGMPSEIAANFAGDAVEGLGADLIDYEDMSGTERLGYNVNRLGTQFGGASGALARTTASPNSPASRGLQTIVPESLLTAPRKGAVAGNQAGQFATDVGAGVGAGVGMTGAEEFMPEGMEGTALGGLLTALGSVAGGVTGAGATSAARGVGNAVRNTAQRATQGRDPSIPMRSDGSQYTRTEADAAARRVQGQAADAGTAAETIRQQSDDMLRTGASPGELPTTGALSRDVGLAGSEVGARSEPNLRGQFLQRDRNVQSRARQFVDESAPAGAEGRDFTGRAERLASTMEDQAQRGVQRAEGQAGGVAKSRAVRGEELQSRRGQKEPASAELDRQFRETLGEEEATRRQLFNDPDMLAEPVDAGKLVDTARAIEADVGPITAPEGVPGGFLARIKSLETTDPETGDVVGYKDLTFKDAQDMRSDVSGAIAEARKANNGPLAHRLIQLKSTLDSYTADLAEGGSAARRQAPQFKVNPEEGEGFDAWRDRVYRPENRGPDNKSVQPNVFYRGMSDAEFEATQRAGNAAPFDRSEGLFVSEDPDRYAGGGSYGAKRGGYIVQFDTSGMNPRSARSRHVAGLEETAFDEIPTDRIVRVWKWDPERQDHVLQSGPTPRGGAQNAAQRALANERENFAPRFREGQAAKQRQALKSGDETRTRPSEFGGRFLSRTEDAQSLGRALNFEGNPEAVRNARNWLGGKLAESGVVGSDRAIKPSALQSWREKNRGVLRAVPGADAEVAKILKQAQRGEKLSAEYGTNVRAAKEAAKGVERQTKSGPLGLVRGKEPSKAVAAVFSSGDPERNMDDLIRQVGNDKKAREGLKAAVRDYLIDRTTTTARQKTAGGERPVSFAKLDNLFAEHEKTLAKVYTPAEMNTLRSAHKFLEPLTQLNARATSGSDTTEKLSLQVRRGLEAGLKAKYGVLKGGGIMRVIKIGLESLPNNEEAVTELIGRMYFDPDLAGHLLTRNVKQVGTPEWNSRLNQLLGVAEGGRATYSQEED